MTTLSESQIYAAAKAAGFTSSQAVIATAIAMAESGGDPAATHRNTNGTTDYGLWQINSVHTSLFAGGANWKDPLTNARMAHSVFRSQGWRAWTTYKSGAYKQHTDAGTAQILEASHDNVPTLSANGQTITSPTDYAPGSGVQNASTLGDLGSGLAGIGKGLTNLNPFGLNPLGNSTLSDLGKGLKAMFTLEFWERAGWGLAGFVLALIGLVFMLESNKTTRGLTEAAVMA